LIERLLARCCTDVIVVISQSQLNDLCDVFKIGKRAQYRVIPLGMELTQDTAPPRLRRELHVSSDAAVIGFVGRLSPIKNIEMLFRAAKKLISNSARDIHLAIVGDGQLRQDLEFLARELGIRDRVHFLGFRNDAVQLYGGMDVVALSSVNEGTPLTLIEAMSAGVSVIATEVGGVGDLMGQTVSDCGAFRVCQHGLLINSGDVDALADGLRFLLSRPDVRHEIGQRASSHVAKTYSVQRLIADLVALYSPVHSR
jgi:glycosyltransferase involved in cell wall biosynthesis